MENKIAEWLIDQNGNYNINSFKNILDHLFAKREGYYSWSGLKYLLYEYELKLMEERGMVDKIDWNLFVRNEKDKFSIEHIFPQTPNNNYWKERFDKFNENQKKLLTNSLGNLVGLSQSINSSLQNDDFNSKKMPKIVNGEKKREGYLNGSFQEIEISYEGDWTENQILSRGLKLINFMEERWEIKFKNEEEKRKLLYWQEITYNNSNDFPNGNTNVNDINIKYKVRINVFFNTFILIFINFPLFLFLIC